METRVGHRQKMAGFGFYRTYKEWKQNCEGNIKNAGRGFYCTYKEWKLATLSIIILNLSLFLLYL